MTTPTEPPVPPGRPLTARPGRKLGPILPSTASAHRAWLQPMRDTYLASGLTLNELSERIRFAKSIISELLRGVGLYPRWEIVCMLAVELGVPNWPLYQLWRQAAFEAHKSNDWIDDCTDRTTVLTTTHTAALSSIAPSANSPRTTTPSSLRSSSTTTGVTPPSPTPSTSSG
ncbi:hypothetical protein ABT300_06615 [Streptomyces sp. NPDC001027]|uniref:hypothetical protein n=1 Tax=Streptomyces sp. NPDC001027 TaxID=3154771 RepID=UPI003320B9DF